MLDSTTNPITAILGELEENDRVFVLPAVMVVVSEEQYRAMIAESQLDDRDEAEN